MTANKLTKTDTVEPLTKLAEIELQYNGRTPPKQRPKAGNSSEVYDILMSVWDMNKIELVEQAVILYLDRSKRCFGFSTIATGGTDMCVIDPKIVYVAALQANASSIIIAHNHPSGRMLPSEPDKELTYKLVEAGKFLTLPLTDHIIVSPFGYLSMVDEGYMP